MLYEVSAGDMFPVTPIEEDSDLAPFGSPATMAIKMLKARAVICDDEKSDALSLLFLNTLPHFHVLSIANTSIRFPLSSTLAPHS